MQCRGMLVECNGVLPEDFGESGACAGLQRQGGFCRPLIGEHQQGEPTL